VLFQALYKTGKIRHIFREGRYGKKTSYLERNGESRTYNFFMTMDFYIRRRHKTCPEYNFLEESLGRRFVE
jgi:hypothetical protein